MPDLRFLTPVPLCLLLVGAACGAPLAAATAATATTAVDASVVAAAVKQRLRAEREQELADLTVQVLGDGTVWLSGRTYTQAMADRALQIARTTPGVTRVRSDILAAPETQR
jgi:osmotically-inducible protein OsmY